MDHKVTRQLLDKYFEGKTSLQEEAQLRQTFQAEELPEDLQPFRPLFRYLQEEQSASLPENFDEQLMAQLDGPSTAGQGILRLLPPQGWLLRAAAVLALVVGALWLYQPAETATETAAIDWSKYELQDPEKALEITQSALLRASSELQQGTSVASKEFDTKLKRVGKYFN